MRDYLLHGVTPVTVFGRMRQGDTSVGEPEEYPEVTDILVGHHPINQATWSALIKSGEMDHIHDLFRED